MSFVSGTDLRARVKALRPSTDCRTSFSCSSLSRPPYFSFTTAKSSSCSSDVLLSPSNPAPPNSGNGNTLKMGFSAILVSPLGNLTTGAADLTLRAGIFGYPIRHSISPPMHQAAFDHAGIDATYEAWETHPGALAEGVSKLRDSVYLGANVTVPHKQAVMETPRRGGRPRTTHRRSQHDHQQGRQAAGHQHGR